MPAALPVSVAPVASSLPGAASSPRSDGGDADFSRHLSAARQPRDAEPSDRQAPASGDSVAKDPTAASGPASTTAGTPEKAPSKGEQADLTPLLAIKAEPDDPSVDPASNPGALATAMLALLGHAPAAAVSAAAGGASKVLAAGVHKGAAPQAGGLAPDGQPFHGQASTNDDGRSSAPASGPAATAGASGASSWVQQGTTVFGVGSLSAFDPAIAGAAGHKADRERPMSDLAALLPAGPAPTSLAAIGPAHALQVSSPAGSAAFAQELGQHVAWLGGQDIKQAKIRLHPEELGQLDVKVSVQHTGQVDVTFAAQHPAAVHVVQQTLPQLDALLAQHGLSLGQAEVGQRHAGGDRQPGQPGGGAGGDAIDEPTAVAGTSAPAVGALGLLDMFA